MQIGEHLMSAKVSRGSKIDRLVGPPDMLLIRNDEFDRLFRLLLQSALVASGHDDENKFLAYKPRTPTQRATILPLGFSGDDSPALRAVIDCADNAQRSEEHTSELQSLMRISYAVFCLKKKTTLTV